MQKYSICWSLLLLVAQIQYTTGTLIDLEKAIQESNHRGVKLHWNTRISETEKEKFKKLSEDVIEMRRRQAEGLDISSLKVYQELTRTQKNEELKNIMPALFTFSGLAAALATYYCFERTISAGDPDGLFVSLGIVNCFATPLLIYHGYKTALQEQERLDDRLFDARKVQELIAQYS